MASPRRVAIMQSSYIPWRGYFSIIARCDAVVILDSVQFTRRDWRTRNRIKTPAGLRWLSIPVRQKGNYLAPIDGMEIADPGWAQTHMRSIEASYGRSPGFSEVMPALRQAYMAAAAETLLTQVNVGLIAAFCHLLGITTPLLRDVDMLSRDELETLGPSGRLVALSASMGAEDYLSGPSARAYLDEGRFEAVGIRVSWMDYGGLPAYPQLWGEYEPAVSVVDALLNLGPAEARRALGV